MPTDTQIHSTQVEPAPLDYPVPLNAELLLKAVNATFTDNGAGGDWLPCLTLISDAGSVIARAVDQGVKVTAGSDAEVSWFPGVKPKGAAAAGGTAHACHIALNYTTPSGTVTAPNGGTLMTIASFDTDDPASYVQVDATSWQIPPVPQVVAGFVVEQSAAVVTPAADARIVAQSGGSVPFGPFVPSGTRFLTSWFGYALSRNIELQNDWHAFAAGGGVLKYSLTVTYFAVY